MQSRHRVLVIDDEQSVRDAFSDALEGAPYDDDTASCGADGVCLVKQHKYDLVFLDLKMPGMDGVETLRALHEHECRAEIYIVTAFHPEFLDRLEAAEREGLRFELVCKPIGQDGIREIARTCLSEGRCMVRRSVA